ncbi:hypothetical protein [Arachidicoccus sp.]|uniref:hypothetical protein n=1 Tax=Arachidicoccus sp. TaxID=1872624 RepID=UPI003D23D4F5
MQTQIMIFGKEEKAAKEIFNALRLQKRWEIVVLLDAEKAIECMHQQRFDLIIITKDVAVIDENKLRKIGNILHEDILFLKHENVESIEKEIAVRLNRQKLQKSNRFSIKDDAFKNIVYNISMN